MKKKKHRKLFCEYGPLCYEIASVKEQLKRHIIDFFSTVNLAKKKSKTELPFLIKGHSSILIRRLNGVDINLQKSKVKNIQLACDAINGIVVHPGEVFSFWTLVGKPTRKRGFQDGLIIGRGGFRAGVGGGLCQMANMVHYLVLNSPLEVVELHHHSDALFPDDRRKVPFGTGTSVSFNSVDYRFKNNLDHDVQILVWIEDEELRGELRSAKDIPYRYKLVEEDHHFAMERKRYFRNSKVYRITIDKKTNKEINKELILDNHSIVLYDYSLIPKDEIRNDNENDSRKNKKRSRKKSK